jgi:hypothetical protein
VAARRRRSPPLAAALRGCRRPCGRYDQRGLRVEPPLRVRAPEALRHRAGVRACGGPPPEIAAARIPRVLGAGRTARPSGLEQRRGRQSRVDNRPRRGTASCGPNPTFVTSRRAAPARGRSCGVPRAAAVEGVGERGRRGVVGHPGVRQREREGLAGHDRGRGAERRGRQHGASS